MVEKEIDAGIGRLGRRRHHDQPVPAASGGKRLRPSLLLLCSRAGGRRRETSAIRLGAVVEMIHAATLVHDDVIDMAQTRRGRPSTNVQWGNHTCVLAGDWLYMQAFQVALRERNFHVLDLLISLTQMMVEGELIQLDRIGQIDVTEADCMELVDRKTAGLFSACARWARWSAGRIRTVEERARRVCLEPGDGLPADRRLLDFTSREKTLGQAGGRRLARGQGHAAPGLRAGAGDQEERRQVETILREQRYDAATIPQVRAMIRKYGAVERVRERAQQFTEKARQVIGEFPDSPYQSALTAVTDLIVDRDY